MTRLAGVAIGAAAVWVCVATIVRLLDMGEWWHGPVGVPRGALLLYLLLQLGLPSVAAGWAAAKLFARLPGKPVHDRVKHALRLTLWPLAIAYGLTAAFGCPAVHNTMVQSALKSCQVREGWAGCSPRLETYLALPVLPFVVLSYQEAEFTYHDGQSAGAGGFLLHVWNSRDAIRVATYSLWAAP